MSFFRALKTLDAYPKTQEDYRIRTVSGALLSIISVGLISLLLFSELSYYSVVDVQNELSVDTSRGEKLVIHFDFVFHSLPCQAISVDVMDISGATQLDITHNLFKKRLSAEGHPLDIGRKEHKIGKEDSNNTTEAGEPCGDCYGAVNQGEEHPCCNTCDELRRRYSTRGWDVTSLLSTPQCLADEGYTIQGQPGEGCNVYGFLEVNKVTGNFHFAPGRTMSNNGIHMHDLSLTNGMVNLTHTIRHLSFGDHFPGVVYPLNGVKKVAPEESTGQIYKYFVKVVPTIYRPLLGEAIRSNQYSSTEHFTEAKLDSENSVPGILIHYEASPIMVLFTEQLRSLTHFATSACGIIGGIMTVTGLIDSFIHRTSRPKYHKTVPSKGY